MASKLVVNVMLLYRHLLTSSFDPDGHGDTKVVQQSEDIMCQRHCGSRGRCNIKALIQAAAAMDKH